MLAYVVFMLAPVMFIYLFLNFFVAQVCGGDYGWERGWWGSMERGKAEEGAQP